MAAPLSTPELERSGKSRAPLSAPPRLPWPSLLARLERDWEEGSHITIVAPTRHGKTHLALELTELSSHVLVLATKRKDPLVTQLAGRGYHVTGSTEGILWTAENRNEDSRPVTPKVVVWPQFGEEVGAAQRIALQTEAFRNVLDWADKTGGWTIVSDETMWLHDRLRLEKELSTVWYQGRTQGLTMIALMQRPSRVPRLAFSQSDYLFLGKFADKRDIDELREISSAIPTELIVNGIRSLSKPAHEFLFIDTVRDELAIVVAPAR